MIKFYFVLFFVFMQAHHKFYLSLTEIRYAKENHELQIAIKLFTDDLELAVRNEFGKSIKITKGSKEDSLSVFVGKYLKNHFKLDVNNKNLDIVYLGYETEMEATWCYMQVENIKKIKELRVKDNIFIELFDNQVNIVNFIIDNETKSFIGDSKTTQYTYTF